MLALEKCADMLRDFGLTLNQAKVYLAAVQLGMAPVSKISSASNVRREDTYRALAKLENLGLVEKIPDKHVRIRAVPAEEALSILIKKWQDSVGEKERTLTIKKRQFLDEFKTHKKAELEENKVHFALLLEKDAVVNHVTKMLSEAEKEFSLITSADEIMLMLPAPFAERSLDSLSRKGVKARIIVEVPKHETSIAKRAESSLSARVNLELKCLHRPVSHFFVVDYKQALIATTPEPCIGKLPYLWTDTASFVELLQRSFEELWHNSVDLKKLKTEPLPKDRTTRI